MNSSILVLLSICAFYCANAQYGAQNAPPAQYYPQPLSDNYRPTTNFCQDSFKQDSCDKCCKMAARIDGTNIKEESIVGFKMVLERQPLCVCCSPNAGY
ncbi:Protein CBG22399 [Caenorhabditis briggsae]|uniref:Protein CBG22399 n=1 Tax=Caenorhabditis briggsae TaxID=6238 RepID=A8Y254_CAEBR|nr:Protein CBG22399 [Caenorhabditis briggsae]CAP38994.1 Protein CBG22399 [Caenorhabditis briggsae]